MAPGRWVGAIILALTLVLQTAAAAALHAASPLGEEHFSRHCRPGGAIDGKAPKPDGQHEHDCLSCAFCALGSAAGVDRVSDACLAAFFRDGATLDFRTLTEATHCASSRRAQSPRGPPALS